MIHITPSNTDIHFEREIVDSLFNYIHSELETQILLLPKIGGGFMCFPDIPTKTNGEQNVYIEYNYEVLAPKTVSPIPFKLEPHRVIIFSGDIPDEIKGYMNTIEKLINDSTMMN